ncbi:PepSY domain-containing protein [Entomohabitans teleogrylli]|uniref:PepSY domain-containing protein n=1 Tax=Entomohabitans teleogrylli TaxID=1384589 RepID=UPI00073DB207|nr:PepSY domain-containing protein [Entomohabitans teleogrylli]
MKSFFPAVIVIVLTGSGAALASDDCRRPMAEWQSRDTVSDHVTELGITTDRLRIDDGCYEIRGRDNEGNRIKLKLDPATLEPLKLEVRFQPGSDTSRYLSVPDNTSSNAPPLPPPSQQVDD